MTSASGTLSTRLAQAVPSRTARRAIGIVGFAVATAVGARIAVPLAFTPVPFTLQVLVVLLAGALLRARLGAASQLLYLAAGAAGLPVFAAGGGLAYLLGPTGGYLLALPAAAFVVGSLCGPAVWRTLLALGTGVAVIYAGGVAWLAAYGGLTAAVALGLTPFVLGDLVKVLLASLIARRYRDAALRFFAS